MLGAVLPCALKTDPVYALERVQTIARPTLSAFIEHFQARLLLPLRQPVLDQQIRADIRLFV